MILVAIAILTGLLFLWVAFGHLNFNSKVQSEIDSISKVLRSSLKKMIWIRYQICLKTIY